MPTFCPLYLLAQPNHVVNCLSWKHSFEYLVVFGISMAIWIVILVGIVYNFSKIVHELDGVVMWSFAYFLDDVRSDNMCLLIGYWKIYESEFQETCIDSK